MLRSAETSVKARSEDRLKQVADRVMNHPVAQVSGANLTALQLEGLKDVIGTRLIRSRQQLILQLQQLPFEVEKESRGGVFPLLTAQDLLRSQEQVVERDGAFKQIAVTFHHEEVIVEVSGYW